MTAGETESQQVDRMLVDASIQGLLHFSNHKLSRHTIALGTRNDRVFKIYDTQYAKEYRNELSSLRLAEGTDCVPAVFGGGEFGFGGFYIEMQRLPGVCLREIFDNLDLAEKRRCLAAIMLWRAKLSRVGNRDSVTVRGAFTQASRLTWAASKMHRLALGRRDLAAACYQYASRLLNDNAFEPISLVHRDFSLRNILVKYEEGMGLSLTGVLDFEHAFIGSPASDIADLVIEDFSANPDMATDLIEAWRRVSPTPVSCDQITGAIGLNLLLGLVREEKCGRRMRSRLASAQQVLEWLPRL